MVLVDKSSIARALRDISMYLQLKGESPFRARAYDVAAELYGRGSTPHQAVLAGWRTVGITLADQARLNIKVAEAVDLPAGGAEIPAMLFLRM